MKILTIFLLSTFLILSINSLQTHTRNYSGEQNHDFVHPKEAKWIGSQCNKFCENAGGIVCGKIIKQCCIEGCQGILIRECINDKMVSHKDLSCGKTNLKQEKTQVDVKKQ